MRVEITRFRLNASIMMMISILLSSSAFASDWRSDDNVVTRALKQVYRDYYGKPYIPDIDVQSALAIAYRKKKLTENDAWEIKNFLRTYDLNIDSKDRDGASFLIVAAEYGNPSYVKALIQLGADVNLESRTDGWHPGRDGTPLQLFMESASSDKETIETIRAFVKAGVKINAKNKYGYTALMSAAVRQNSEIVSELIRNGADVNAQDQSGETALMQVADSYVSQDSDMGLNIMNVLVSKGAHVRTKDNQGKTALDHAHDLYKATHWYSFMVYGREIGFKDGKERRQFKKHQWAKVSYLKNASNGARADASGSSSEDRLSKEFIADGSVKNLVPGNSAVGASAEKTSHAESAL